MPVSAQATRSFFGRFHRPSTNSPVQEKYQPTRRYYYSCDRHSVSLSSFADKSLESAIIGVSTSRSPSLKQRRWFVLCSVGRALHRDQYTGQNSGRCWTCWCIRVQMKPPPISGNPALPTDAACAIVDAVSIENRGRTGSRGKRCRGNGGANEARR